MKKFLKSILLFAVFAVIFYIAMLFAWGTYAPIILTPNLNYRIGSYGHMHSRLKELKEYKDVDVLLLGSSHAYRGFDTRILKNGDNKVFNLGSSSQTAIQTKLLLTRYLDQLNPKIIVYEVYPTTFSLDGVESSVDIIANSKNDRNTIKMAFDINHIKTYNTLIYGLIRDILNLNSSFSEDIIKGKDTYIPGGFVEKDISHFRYSKYPKEKWTFKDDQFVAFEECLAMIRERNIKVILVNAPVTSASYNSYTNNKQFDSIMNSYGDYYNFNEMLSLDDSLYFYDSHHLNQNGVEIFNNKLIEIIYDE